MNRARVAKGFDFLAPFYDKLLNLTLGKSVKKSQLAYFSYLKEVRSVLVFGGGSGWILNEIDEYNPQKITYIDLSPKMASMAKNKDIKCNVDFIVGSYEDLPSEHYDVIITPYVLDCFNEMELGLAIKNMSKRLVDNGVWLFSDFNNSNKSTHKLLVRGLYAFFNVACGLKLSELPPFDSIFKQNGLVIKRSTQYMNGLIRSDVFIKVQ